ncbi:P-type conjugative transfer protein TrbG [Rhodoligotrophos defluvii]|uniref:P-type conjugative transfer protein TrbG n=1 Tax=Rhodoligotrophos defluvii TaxID=2561934 RepID=UPI0010C97DC6|nr:P-type conjugative transfer protein TrbG [Rhodoligotrophos defluvii]
MTPIRILLFGASALAIAACAADGAPPPEISYDSDDFAPATVEPEPSRPVEIVTLPEPLPLPGQLKPVPDRDPAAPDKRPPPARVDAANKAARLEPTKHGYVNAVQVYPFTAGALYRLYAAPEQVSDIALQPGEKLVAVSAGDTVRWVVGDTTSGSGDEQQVHILVKPVAPDLETNLVITTDRRAYHLELESTERTYMASVSWHYPHDQLIALRRQNERAIDAEARVVDRGLSLDRLRFRYEITGDDPPWRPVRAFDDTNKVYIEFPRRIDQGEAPPLFVVGSQGGAELVNYRVRDNYYIVDRLFAAAELRLGEDPQQVVRISRTDGRAANADSAQPLSAEDR